MTFSNWLYENTRRRNRSPKPARRRGSVSNVLVATIAILVLSAGTRADVVQLNPGVSGTIQTWLPWFPDPYIAPHGDVLAGFDWSAFPGSEWRGFVEFNLDLIPSLPTAAVNLVLPDGGGATVGLSTTHLYWYTATAEGVLNVTDWYAPGTYFATLQRPFMQAFPTVLDVTSLVQHVGGGWLGIRFMGENNGTTQQDSFAGTHMRYEPIAPTAVPLPTSLAAGAALLAWLGVLRSRAR